MPPPVPSGGGSISRPALSLPSILAQARACTVCAPYLPLGPRPVVRAAATARILIIGQAPGTRVHETGIPWNDRSGDRLREWLGLDRDIFYDESRIAIVPMGFCYPGVAPNGGDNPPRPECAPLWHPRILPLLPDLRFTLLVGSHAQKRYLPSRLSMSDTVAGFRDHLPATMPLPHPSWRTIGWERRNPWFEAELLPALRAAISAALG